MTNNIEQHRRAKKMSMEALGQAIGTDASTISKIEKGKISIKSDRLQRIAQALNVSVEDLLGDLPEAITTTTRNAQPEPTERPQIPVMGAAAGSLLQGTFQITEGPVEWIDPPKALESAKGIYAVYVDGESMEPMFRHGSKVIVSEYRPARIGDAVIVEEKPSDTAPIRASIGILQSRGGDNIVLGKLNPHGVIEIPKQFVLRIHKVLEYAELMG